MDIFKIKLFKSEIDRLQSAIQELGAFDYYKIKEMTDLL